MTKRTRRNHAPAVEAKVAPAAIEGEKTLARLAQQVDVHPDPITTWRSRLLEGAAGAFGAGRSEVAPAGPVELEWLHAEIGQSTLAHDFVRRARQCRPAERSAMIDRDHALPLVR